MCLESLRREHLMPKWRSNPTFTTVSHCFAFHLFLAKIQPFFQIELQRVFLVHKKWHFTSCWARERITFVLVSMSEANYLRKWRNRLSKRYHVLWGLRATWTFILWFIRTYITLDRIVLKWTTWCSTQCIYTKRLLGLISSQWQQTLSTFQHSYNNL